MTAPKNIGTPISMGMGARPYPRGCRPDHSNLRAQPAPKFIANSSLRALLLILVRLSARQKGNPGEGIWRAKEAISGDSRVAKVVESFSPRTVRSEDGRSSTLHRSGSRHRLWRHDDRALGGARAQEEERAGARRKKEHPDARTRDVVDYSRPSLVTLFYL